MVRIFEEKTRVQEVVSEQVRLSCGRNTMFVSSPRPRQDTITDFIVEGLSLHRYVLRLNKFEQHVPPDSQTEDDWIIHQI